MPLPDGKSIPVSGVGQPMVINVYVGNEQLDARIDRRADNIRVMAGRRGLGTARMF